MILLQILKIIGIVLLVIIGLIILIICLVLFAPFSYKITGSGENEDLAAQLKVTWLGGLLNLGGSISRNETFELKTHFAGIEIKKKENSLISRIIKRIGLAIWEILKEHFFGIIPEKKKKAKSADKAAAGGSEGADPGSDEEDDSPKFVRKFHEIWDKVKNIWEKLKLAKYVIGAPVTARAWQNLKLLLLGLFNHVRPKSMEGEVEFGTGDPASTAQAYGMAGWIAAMLDERLLIIPDMENKLIRMNVVIKGRIFVRYVLSFLWKLLTDRDIRRVVGYIGRNL